MSRRKPDVVHIAITCADDTVAIMAFVTCEYTEDDTTVDTPRWRRTATPASIDAEIARMTEAWKPTDAAKLPIKRWAPVNVNDVPADRTFRNALRHDGQRFSHDMAHARTLHRDRLREARRDTLSALDVAYQRADEANDLHTKREIAAKKQALRDVTKHPGIEAASTVAELAAVWPEVLDA